MYRALATIFCCLLILVPASAATAGVLESRLGDTRAQSRDVKRQMSAVDRRQASIVKQVSSLNRRIAELDVPINHLSVEIDGLDYRIDRRQARIAKLKRDFVLQKAQIRVLNGQLDDARELLATRVVAAYKSGDTGMLEQLAGSGNLAELFARQEALGQVVGVDDRIIRRIATTERTVRLKRARNHQVQAQIHADIRDLANARGDVEAKRAAITAQRNEVAGVKAQRDGLLKQLTDREAALGKRLDGLEEDEKVLQEAIKTGSVSYSGQIGALGSSASGIAWPVSGPVISPFGQRWGRLHAGVDIAVGTGTPIHAAAGGVVTYAGWMSGYGNMVIIQHAGNLSTGYAHQSQIATSVGQLVAQGQVIGFVGCTGHCFGPHLHFETREGGSAVDPMKYL